MLSAFNPNFPISCAGVPLSPNELATPIISTGVGIFSIKTLIVYYNGQRRHFKSMTPPETVQQLFETLSSIAIDKKLKRATVKKDIEE
ncbi:hypothetical protein WG954_14425 [Lacibacter sp. H375]|uniref:hypothetical protein n=1 Tax=Lacibacter sp. H375 TaxID=3133424 RepID=UPI0030C5BD38